DNTPCIGVIRLPHIANFTDIDPLLHIKGLNVVFLETVQSLDMLKALIIPGSKNTRNDLNWLHETGWGVCIQQYITQGGYILGICGGYQMLGRSVHDPEGIEGLAGSTLGLGLLPVETYLKAPKTTRLISFTWDLAKGMGYEIHMGQTLRFGEYPLFEVLSNDPLNPFSEDGCRTDNFRVIGTYIHGCLDNPGILQKWFDILSLKTIQAPEISGHLMRDKAYDHLVEHFVNHIDMNQLMTTLLCVV
ncbi:MAG: cobyric acid synthase, partial [Desulfobacterales bacterium]|nr:cobyric acid synthase [Desulfobacterales bacterium]